MIISVASGKGGTGKTLISTSLALSLGGNVQFLDCDVEEPNAHIFLKPEITAREDAFVPVPEVDEKKCDHCGKCAEVCEYNAIVVAREKVLIFPQLCHSCGGCVLLCPQKAFREKKRGVGVLELGTGSGLETVTGRLNVGEVMPVPLVAAVKKKIDPQKTVIIDAPPGTSCPVVEAVKGSDYCILVTESTPFGLSDLELAVGVLRKMNVPCGAVINKYDRAYPAVEKFCGSAKVPVLLKIPEDRNISQAYSRGEPLIKAFPEYTDKFVKLFKEVGQ